MSYGLNEIVSDHDEKTQEMMQDAISSYEAGELDDDQAPDFDEAIAHAEEIITELESALVDARFNLAKVEREAQERLNAHETKMEEATESEEDCNGCGESFERDDLVPTDDGAFCESCVEERVTDEASLGV